MKLTILLLMLSTVAFANSKQSQNLSVIEIDVSNVYIAPKGYDNNDNVEIYIDGKLPNPCWDIYNTEITKDITNNIFTVKQFAKQKDIRECNKDHEGHNQMNFFSVQFGKVEYLGELKVGDYKINFKTKTGNKSIKFNVSEAISDSIDNHMYAPISSAFIPELIYETDNAQMIMTGILENTCMEMDQANVEVIKFDHLFLVLPKLNINNNAICLNDERPLQLFINLGTVSAGRYLVHIRSMSGRSVNRTFTVKKQIPLGPSF